MAKFYVKYGSEIPDRRLFILAGSIMEGEVEAGMFIRVPFNAALQLTARIQSIEFALQQGGNEDVCLCFEAEPEMIEIWRGLNINDETLQVTREGSD